MSKFSIEDSGKRESFSTGAVRDVADDKPRPDLISPFFMRRLGEHLAKGAKKYSEWNWAKGIDNARCFQSAYRHLLAYQCGETNEDHLAAAAFNLMAIIHNEEVTKGKIKLNTGFSPDTLINYPVFAPIKADIVDGYEDE